MSPSMVGNVILPNYTIPRVLFFFFFLTRRYSCIACWKCVDSVSTLSQCSCHWFSDNTFGVKLDLVCHVIYPTHCYNASTLYLPNSLWFLQKYIKLDQKSWKSAQTSRRVNPMVASFYAFCLLPQLNRLNSDRSCQHNIFCRMERAKQSRCKRWWWSEKKTIYQNLRVMLLY